MQRQELAICNQQVVGSSPITSSKKNPRYIVVNAVRRGFLFAYIQADFDANGHNLGINLFKTQFSADFLPLFDSVKDVAQSVGRCCI